MGALIILATGILINSALFFIFVFVAALLSHNHWSMILAIAGTGVTYLSYYMQVGNLASTTRIGHWVAGGLVLTSIGLGIAAGLLLV